MFCGPQTNFCELCKQFDPHMCGTRYYSFNKVFMFAQKPIYKMKSYFKTSNLTWKPFRCC